MEHLKLITALENYRNMVTRLVKTTTVRHSWTSFVYCFSPCLWLFPYVCDNHLMENGSRFSVAFIIMSTCPRSSGTGQISHDYPGLGWEHVVRGSGSPSRGMKGLVEIVRITPEIATEQKCVRKKKCVWARLAVLEEEHKDDRKAWGWEPSGETIWY